MSHCLFSVYALCPALFYRSKRLCYILYKVFCAFKPTGEAHKISRYSRCFKLCIIHLPVSGACRVQAAGSCVSYMGCN